jgi:hypothetical protein
MIEVNTMNFCTFASLPDPAGSDETSGLLIAVPNTLESESVSPAISGLASAIRN